MDKIVEGQREIVQCRRQAECEVSSLQPAFWTLLLRIQLSHWTVAVLRVQWCRKYRIFGKV